MFKGSFTVAKAANLVVLWTSLTGLMTLVSCVDAKDRPSAETTHIDTAAPADENGDSDSKFPNGKAINEKSCFMSNNKACKNLDPNQKVPDPSKDNPPAVPVGPKVSNDAVPVGDKKNVVAVGAAKTASAGAATEASAVAQSSAGTDDQGGVGDAEASAVAAKSNGPATFSPVIDDLVRGLRAQMTKEDLEYSKKLINTKIAVNGKSKEATVSLKMRTDKTERAIKLGGIIDDKGEFQCQKVLAFDNKEIKDGFECKEVGEKFGSNIQMICFDERKICSIAALSVEEATAAKDAKSKRKAYSVIRTQLVQLSSDDIEELAKKDLATAKAWNNLLGKSDSNVKINYARRKSWSSGRLCAFSATYR